MLPIGSAAQRSKEPKLTHGAADRRKGTIGGREKSHGAAASEDLATEAPEPRAGHF